MRAFGRGVGGWGACACNHSGRPLLRCAPIALAPPVFALPAIGPSCPPPPPPLQVPLLVIDPEYHVALEHIVAMVSGLLPRLTPNLTLKSRQEILPLLKVGSCLVGGRPAGCVGG